MNRQFAAGLFLASIGLMVGYVLATALVDYMLPGSIGYGYIATHLPTLQSRNPDLLLQVGLIHLICALMGFAFGVHSASEKLTEQGSSSWQSLREMKRNDLLGQPGKGFVLAKTTRPDKNGTFITSDAFPNCLVVAPTGAGKGVGFVYPNLLTFQGSTVTLDIKGENYETTARWRAEMGDKVYRFAPVEFGAESYRYNPLERIGKMTDYSQVTFELRKIANLFLQAEAAGEWLNGAIQLFTAAGAVAYERNDLTLGTIYQILAEGDSDLRKHIGNLAKQANEPALRRELEGLHKLESKTLSSYMSVMNNAGFDLWSNPHIAKMTSRSDFSFADLRRERTSIYFTVADGDLKPLAGLVRLFFNELVSTIQASKPGADEPYHAMIILDEFHRLGKMSDVAEAMTTIRGFNGRIAIITQTIPKLDAIYSYEERLSIQGGAGLKLYMTPSEEMTIEDLSKACGMTTKRMITKSRRTGIGEKTTISERTDEKPLLTEDEARRLPTDTSIIIVNGKQPVKVKPIIHYKDKLFASILAKQDTIGWEKVSRNPLEARLDQVEDELAAANAAKTGQGGSSTAQTQGESSEKNEAAEEASPRVITTDDLKNIRHLSDLLFELFDGISELAEKKPVAVDTDEAAAKKPRTSKRTGKGSQTFGFSADVQKTFDFPPEAA